MDLLLLRISETANITTQEFLDKLLTIFPNYKIELIEITTEPQVQEVGWWEGLPLKTPLKVLKETTVWRMTDKTRAFKVVDPKTDDLQYWGEVRNMGNYKMAKVFGNPILWVDVNDVRPK